MRFFKIDISDMHHRITYMYINFQQNWVYRSVKTVHTNLCGKPANLEHVLSSCRTALTEGRYTWRHNMVLKEVADGLEEA